MKGTSCKFLKAPKNSLRTQTKLILLCSQSFHESICTWVSVQVKCANNYRLFSGQNPLTSQQMWTPFLTGNMAITLSVFPKKLFKAVLMQREVCCFTRVLWLSWCPRRSSQLPLLRYPRHRLTCIVAFPGQGHLAGLAAKQREWWDRTYISGSDCSFQGPINSSFPSPGCNRLLVETMQGNL